MASCWEYKCTPPHISLIDVFLDLQYQQAFKKLQRQSLMYFFVFLVLAFLCTNVTLLHPTEFLS